MVRRRSDGKYLTFSLAAIVLRKFIFQSLGVFFFRLESDSECHDTHGEELDHYVGYDIGKARTPR